MLNHGILVRESLVCLSAVRTCPSELPIVPQVTLIYPRITLRIPIDLLSTPDGCQMCAYDTHTHTHTHNRVPCMMRARRVLALMRFSDSHTVSTF